MGVVANLGAFLVAVQRLDGGINVQHPWAIQRVAYAVHQRFAHPRLGGLRLHRLERATYRVFADQTLQAQRLRGDCVTANAGNVGVALAARQDAQHQRAQHVARTRRVGAAVAQRAGIDPAVEHAGGGQEFGKERDLPVRRGLRRFVPAHVHAPTHRVDHHRVFAGLRQHGFLLLDYFTHRVSLPNDIKPAPVLAFPGIALGQLLFLGSSRAALPV